MKYLLMGLIVLLSACSMFGPVQTPDQHQYMINAMPVSFKPMRHTHAIILVTQPITAEAYNTTNMAYTVKPYQLSYYSQNQWAETPSEMFLPLLTQSLERTNAFRAVVLPPYIGHYDYVINTQIIKMQQNYLNPKAGLFEIAVQVQIVKPNTGAIIASHVFTVRSPIGDASPYNGVIAANEAMARLLIQIGSFTVNALG